MPHSAAGGARIAKGSKAVTLASAPTGWKFLKQISGDKERTATAIKACRKAAKFVADQYKFDAPVGEKNKPKNKTIRGSIKPGVGENSSGQIWGYVKAAPHQHLVEAGWWHQPTKSQRAAFGSNWKNWIEGKRTLTKIWQNTHRIQKAIVIATCRAELKKIKV